MKASPYLRLQRKLCGGNRVLKEGGVAFCEAQKTFWSVCYAELEDKFGLKWTIMVEEVCTCTDECASGYNPDCTCTHSARRCREKPET